MSWNELCDVVESRLAQISLPVITARQSVSSKNSKVRGLVLGATTRRGARVTVATEQQCWQELLPYIHELARRRPADQQHPYLSVAITTGAVAPHQDHNNSMTSTMSLGNYQGGELLFDEGSSVKTWRTWHMFDGRCRHQVKPYSGQRWSISLFVPGQMRLLQPMHIKVLGQLGFPTQWWLEQSTWEQTLSPSDAQMLHRQGLCLVVDGVPDEVAAIAPIPLEEQRPPGADGLDYEVPSASQQASIHRTHCNLGHPTREAFLRALRISGVRRGIRRWVAEHYKCPSCEAWRPRLQHRTSTLPKTMTFNETLALDCIVIHPPNLQGETWLHCIDMGTRYQTGIKVGDGHTPTSESVWQGLQSCWIVPFGYPRRVIVDQGSEFKHHLRQQLEQQCCQLWVSNAQSPWENGVCERAGGRLKELMELTFEETEPHDSNDVRDAMIAAMYAHNRFTDRSGFTPYQRVTGCLPRASTDLLAVDDPPEEVSSVFGEGNTSSFERAQQVRAAALRAFISHSVKLRVRRAEATHTKTQERFQPGEAVYILRKGTFNRSHRLGPGTVCAVQGSSAWVTAHGELYKVNTMSLRRADPVEIQAVQEIHGEIKDLITDVSRQRQVRDLTQGEGSGASASAADIPRLPATPRLPGTPGYDRRRRASAISTTAASAATNATMDADESQDVEQDADPSDDRTQVLRRRIDPGIAEHVNRIEPHRELEVQTRPEDQSGDAPMEASSSVHQSDQMFQCWVDLEWSDMSSAQCTLEDEDAMAVFASDRHAFMVTKKGSDEVRLSDIGKADQPAFEKAKASECWKMIHEHEGLVPLSMEDSEWVRTQRSHRIIPSRFHWRWKPESQGDHIVKTAKCRWILIGFRDPDVLILEGESPTPQLYSLNVLLQAAASAQWELFQGDLQTAFLQGGQTVREVYVSQPPEGVPELQKGQLLRMNKEIYGSVAAPQRWRQTFVETLKSLGWCQTQFDPCIYVLPEEGGLKGSVGFEHQAIVEESEFMLPPA
eukprot:6490448-Amphidinium_carterae.1